MTECHAPSRPCCCSPCSARNRPPRSRSCPRCGCSNSANKFLGKQTSIGGYERLAVTLRLEGLKDVRSYGNLKVSHARADTGADLIRREKDQGSFFAVTAVPHFRVVEEWQAKAKKADFEVILHRTSRGAKSVRLKGSIDVLLGGEAKHVDFPNFRDAEGGADGRRAQGRRAEDQPYAERQQRHPAPLQGRGRQQPLAPDRPR